MVGSFIVLAIAVILRIILGTLEKKYSFLKTVNTATNWVIIVLAVIFAVIVIITIIGKIFKTRRELERRKFEK